MIKRLAFWIFLLLIISHINEIHNKNMNCKKKSHLKLKTKELYYTECINFVSASTINSKVYFNSVVRNNNYVFQCLKELCDLTNLLNLPLNKCYSNTECLNIGYEWLTLARCLDTFDPNNDTSCVQKIQVTNEVKIEVKKVEVITPKSTSTNVKKTSTKSKTTVVEL